MPMMKTPCEEPLCESLRFVVPASHRFVKLTSLNVFACVCVWCMVVVVVVVVVFVVVVVVDVAGWGKMNAEICRVLLPVHDHLFSVHAVQAS